MVRIVGFGEYVVSDNPDDILKTFALGSCIGITMYCKNPLAMGMAHIVLPTSRPEDDFRKNPGQFADTAVEVLLFKMCVVYGCKLKDLEIKLFGGAQTFSGNRVLSIGRQNYLSVKRSLTSYRLSWDEVEIGDVCYRNVFLNGRDGTVSVIRYNLSEQITHIHYDRQGVEKCFYSAGGVN
jgi:chemotaxis protein CheD